MTNKSLFKIGIFADHTIGYKVTEYLLSQNGKTCQLQFVLTNPRPKNAWWPSIKNLTQNSGIPILYYRDKENLHKQIKRYSLDYIFTFSWRHILSENIILYPKFGAINCHYGLLPRNRGMQPVNWTIINGDKEAGVTYHWIDSKIDNGDIVMQKSVSVHAWDTTYDLLVRIDKAAIKLFKNLWKRRAKLHLLHNKQKPNYQQPLHLIKDYKRTNILDLDKTYKAGELINLLRGKTFTIQSDKSVSVKSIYFIDPDTNKKIYISIKILK